MLRRQHTSYPTVSDYHGENDSNNIKYPLFAYMASDPAHIPHNNVTIYNWTSDDENATIRLVNETGVEE